MPERLVDAIANMEEEQALALTRELLDHGTEPLAILSDCRAAMEIVGKRFDQGQYYIPELILAGEILKAISLQVKPRIRQESAVGKKGRVLVGTVNGDIHDIGKNLVVFVLDANGFEVKDLGVNVPARTFVDATRSFQPDVVALSGLLTIAHRAMKETVEAIQAAGLRDCVKIMIGGGTTDHRVCAYSGADAFGNHAMDAVRLATQWTGVK